MPHPDRPALAAPERQRSRGRIHLAVDCADGRDTRIRDIAEAGPLRLRLPRRAPGACEAVLLNTAGGIACGDHFDVTVRVGPGADLTLTTTAAEKIYRSDGPVSRVETTVALEAGARLAHLPQETILFDRAALERRFEAHLAPDAHLLAFEAVTFGRTARDEPITQGYFTDRWRIRRAGRLVYADSVRLTGALTEQLARRAIGSGARAMATLLDVSPDAEGRLERARALLDEGAAQGVAAAASAWNGHLVMRFLGTDPDALRTLARRVLIAYRGAPLPRVWQS
ncbi:urease accessory protein UreD [Methylobacterium sp. J-068]|uniref:urease accessory protein UreD n=1 Tax=Methylobacterium sp. J-068 TaxID=2836649 RepID=UPI001FBA145B|nr:urease accessory protein UreD [Methylobacterium sp. J-068]MCJ2033709.1 urease accessory protein UreD [Methylobacterium sp. J-068]